MPSTRTVSPTSAQTALPPPPRLGIERAHYVALRTPDPEAAAQFADQQMGFDVVHSDRDGRYYLAAAGLDPYSLVYVPGEPGIEHISYLVSSVEALYAACEALSAWQVACERTEETGLWRSGPAVRFQTAGRHPIQLTTGVNVAVPMGHLVPRPSHALAPIACDHIVTRASDVEAELAFACGPLGLSESGRIEVPGLGPILAFFRAHTLYHCYAVARAESSGLHHVQFTLKDRPAVFAAYDSMREAGRVELLWGPVRHGPGHNVCFYFRDFAGNVFEYSAEEEIILDGGSYVAQVWSAEDPRTMDEWGTRPPDAFG